jgi:hypothetical protein
MTSTSSERLLPWLALALAVLVYGGWAVAPSSGPYTDVLTPQLLLGVAALVKLVYLLAGALWAFACRDRLEGDNPARPAWALLSLGLGATFVGQLSYAPYQLLGRPAPFPSVGDLYFVLAYPFLVAAFLVFLRAYRESGFPTGPLGERLGIVCGVGLLAALVAVPILRPVVSAEGPLLERLLTVIYPVLDLVLLVPLALLLRVALRLRGSHVGSVWALILGGLIFICVGDVSFAYFSALGATHLDPFVHLTFILGYGLVAGGAHRQYELLRA